MNDSGSRLVFELRIAYTIRDFQRTLDFFCKGLGIDPAAYWENDGGKAALLAFDRGTLELFDDTQAQVIDRLEAGVRVSGPIRFAFQVPDVNQAMERLLKQGAVLVHPPVLTPWGDYNVRLADPDGMQITLFELRSPAQ